MNQSSVKAEQDTVPFRYVLLVAVFCGCVLTYAIHAQKPPPFEAAPASTHVKVTVIDPQAELDKRQSWMNSHLGDVSEKVFRDNFDHEVWKFRIVKQCFLLFTSANYTGAGNLIGVPCE